MSNIHQAMAGLTLSEQRDLTPLFDAIIADMTELRTELAAAVADIVAHRAAIVAITAQLDADAGITDTDYAANNDPAATTATTPAALTTVS